MANPFTPGTSVDSTPIGEAERQAVASLRGYAYQVAAAALAWLDLDANGKVYLEVAKVYGDKPDFTTAMGTLNTLADHLKKYRSRDDGRSVHACDDHRRRRVDRPKLEPSLL